MLGKLRALLPPAGDLITHPAFFLFLALALVWIAYRALDPAPPARVVLATGPEQGAYAEFGRRYATELRRHGITVELRATQGAAENLRLLRDPARQVDLAFVQGGAGDELVPAGAGAVDEGLVSLGSLFYEPVWIFYRAPASRTRPGADQAPDVNTLRTLRVNIGAQGSGTANLMLRILRANRIDPASLQLSHLAPTEAVMALSEGRIDALVLVSAPEAPLVLSLLQDRGVGLLDFAQAEAYARRFHFLTAQQLPRGIVDLADNRPARDVSMVAATSTLVARAETHPAVLQLFLQAATRIHGGTSWFSRAGQFPAATDPDLPLAPEAQRFYRAGPPMLQRYLPFWLANFIDRMWVVLVSIVAVVVPLSRIVPPLVEQRVRSRVFRWYAQLRRIEESIGRPDAGVPALIAELDALDDRVGRIRLPLSYTDELYALRTHIELIRRRLVAPAPTEHADPSSTRGITAAP